MQVPMECLCCGTPDPWQVKPVDFVAPFRGQEHSFVVEVNQCQNCGDVSPDREQSNLISAKVRDEHKHWISQELTKARAELHLTIDALVEQTGMARATVSRASSGESLIDASTEKMLWLEIARLKYERNVQIWQSMEPSEKMRSPESVSVACSGGAVQVRDVYKDLIRETSSCPSIILDQARGCAIDYENFAIA